MEIAAGPESLARNELSDFSWLCYPGCVKEHGGRNMWTETTRTQYRREDLRYASDMTDAEWALIEPHMPAQKALGRPRIVPLEPHIDVVAIALIGAEIAHAQSLRLR